MLLLPAQSFLNDFREYQAILGEIRPLTNSFHGQNAATMIKRLLLPTKSLGRYAASLGLVVTQDRCEKFLRQLEANDMTPPHYGNITLKYDHTIQEIMFIQESFLKDIDALKFIFVPSNKIKFFENESVLGVGIKLCFPEINREIKDAGSCIAVGLYTAAVFHLMRSVEYTLRSLASFLDVTLPNTEVKYAEWHGIIDASQKRITEILALPNSTPNKPKAIEDCRAIVVEFSYFKDKFRNAVMHTRADYDENDALGAYNHVGEFIRRVASATSGPKESLPVSAPKPPSA
jgi:hypothetical protein